MVKFGTTTLPGKVTGFIKLKPRIKVIIPIPGREYAFKKDKGGLGMQFVVTGVSGASTKVADEATLWGLADGTARLLDFEDSTATFTCLMFDPKIEVNQRNVTEMLYTLTFEQSA